MLTKAKEGIDKWVKHLEFEFWKLQLWRANPAIVEDTMVESYWSMQPLKNVASTTLLDSQTISIKPWDMSVIHAIAKAITDSGMWLNPQTMADSIIIKVPPLTEERRIEVVKIAKKLSEEAKVSVRNARWESHKTISKAKEDKEISEDEAKELSVKLQELVDAWNKKVEELSKKKEEDIMKI